MTTSVKHDSALQWSTHRTPHWTQILAHKWQQDFRKCGLHYIPDQSCCAECGTQCSVNSASWETEGQPWNFWFYKHANMNPQDYDEK